MPYSSALAQFPSDDAGIIQGTLAAWEQRAGAGRRICDNLRNERFLSDADHAALLRVVLAHGTFDPDVKFPDALLNSYVVKCWALAMRGGSVNADSLPVRLGRAVERERYIAQVTLDRRMSRHDAANIVTELCSGDRGREESAIDDLGGMPMSQYAAWVTWHAADSREDPFTACLSGHAEEVAAVLGLPWKRYGVRPVLLLFAYDRPPGLDLVRPTVADAADHPHFRPPPLSAGDTHGWTFPLPEQELSLSTPVVLSPRPESLHTPLQIDSVRPRIRQLT